MFASICLARALNAPAYAVSSATSPVSASRVNPCRASASRNSGLVITAACPIPLIASRLSRTPTVCSPRHTEAAGHDDPRKAGPAAGKTWSDVAGATCEVEWESGEATQGRVIYIPQNSLYTISEQPDEITKKIAPALFRTYPTLKTAHDSAESKVASANAEIKAAVGDWFALADRVAEKAQEIKDLGDKAAVQAERDRLQLEIDSIKTAAKLTDEEVAKYQQVAGELDTKRARVKEIAVELDQLSPFAAWADGATEPSTVPEAVLVTVAVRPTALELPDSVADLIDGLKSDAMAELVNKIEKVLSDSVAAGVAERASLLGEIQND